MVRLFNEWEFTSSLFTDIPRNTILAKTTYQSIIIEKLWHIDAFYVFYNSVNLEIVWGISTD